MPTRYLLIALAIGSACWLAARNSLRVGPAFEGLAAETRGAFTEGGGWFKGEPLRTHEAVRAWGSWNGSDANTGSLRLGPFPAPARLRLAVGGYPPYAGNSLRLELEGTTDSFELKPPAVGERWRIVDHDVPTGWHGLPVIIVAKDEAKAVGGWMAISEPLQGGVGDGAAGLWQSLAAWTANGILLAFAWIGALRILSRHRWIPAAWLPVSAAAVVALAGYAVFWAYFVGPMPGLFAAIVALAAGIVASRSGAALTTRVRIEVRTAILLTLATGLLHLGMLHFFPSSFDFYRLAGNRFRQDLPTDNQLPHEAAERLYAGAPLRQSGTDWLSSDRPPLQTGWQLLTWWALEALDLDSRAASGTSAIWLQLTWVAAAYGLLRTLGLGIRSAASWSAAMATSGFFIQNTTFTWPKLSAAAFACAAFALWVQCSSGPDRKNRIMLGSALAATAWLSHGGIAFSYLALAPWVIWRCLRGEFGLWLRAALLFLLVGAPWAAFQKLYDPPGNRLLKWHLGGQIAKDERGVWQTIRENYAKLTWNQIIENKRSNLALQNDGRLATLLETQPEAALDRRNQEFFIAGRALTWWFFGLLTLPFAWRHLEQNNRPETRRLNLALFAWTAITVPVWCLLMFEGNQTVIHQGSYAMMLGAFVFLSAWFQFSSPHWLPAVAAAQLVTLLTTWMPGNKAVGGEISTPAAAIAAAGATALLTLVVNAWRKRTRAASPSQPEPAAGSATWPFAASLPWVAAGVAILPAVLCARALSDLWWFGDDWDLLDQIQRVGFTRWMLLPFAENFVPIFKAMWGGLVFAGGGDYRLMIAALWATHALNAGLFARLLLDSGFKPFPAAFATAIFAVSAANIESLAWSVQWSALLATCFLLVCASLAGRPATAPTRRRVAIALLSAASALAFSRGVLTGLVIALVLLTPWVQPGRPRRERWRDAVAGAAPAIVVATLIFLFAAGNHRALGGQFGSATAFALCHWCVAPLYRLLGAVTWHWPLILALGTVKITVVLLVLRAAGTPQRRLLCLLLLFDLGNAALLGLGRHHTGLPAANSERYYYTSLICFLPFLALGLEKWLDGFGRARRAVAASLLLIATLLSAWNWPAAAENFAGHRGRNTREILLRRTDTPASGAVPGIPFLTTNRARELIDAYRLH